MLISNTLTTKGKPNWNTRKKWGREKHKEKGRKKSFHSFSSYYCVVIDVLISLHMRQLWLQPLFVFWLVRYLGGHCTFYVNCYQIDNSDCLKGIFHKCQRDFPIIFQGKLSLFSLPLSFFLSSHVSSIVWSYYLLHLHYLCPSFSKTEGGIKRNVLLKYLLVYLFKSEYYHLLLMPFLSS